MTSEVTFKVKVQGQTYNSIKSSYLNMRELQSLHLGVNQCCNSNETNSNDLKGHRKGQSKNSYFLKQELLELYENMQTGAI